MVLCYVVLCYDTSIETEGHCTNNRKGTQRCNYCGTKVVQRCYKRGTKVFQRCYEMLLLLPLLIRFKSTHSIQQRTHIPANAVSLSVAMSVWPTSLTKTLQRCHTVMA
jgi:hypothetical protein